MKSVLRCSEYMEKNSIFLLSIIFTALFVGHTAVAQDASTSEEEVNSAVPSGGIQISPTKFVWNLAEGEVRTSRVVVKNYSDQEQKVTVEVEDFYVKDDGSTPQLFVPDENHPLRAYDVIDWFTMPEEFTLAPDEARGVEFTVRVPEDMPTGGYYGSLLFRTGGSDDTEGSKIGLSYRIGGLVIMAVQGEQPMKKDGVLAEFYAEKKVFWDTPTVLYAAVDNKGNIHFPLFGDIEVKRFGKLFHRIEMKPRLLYPNTDPVRWREIMPTGIWDFGYFKADIAMHSEDESIQLAGSTTFWVIPWKGLAIIAGVLVGLWIIKKLIGTFFHIERKSKRKKKE